MPLKKPLTTGKPQMNTKTVRMTHGVQAWMTSARGCCCTTTGACATPLSASCPLSDTERQICLGFQTRRKSTRQIIDDIAAMTSTSSGPM